MCMPKLSSCYIPLAQSRRTSLRCSTPTASSPSCCAQRGSAGQGSATAGAAMGESLWPRASATFAAGPCGSMFGSMSTDRVRHHDGWLAGHEQGMACVSTVPDVLLRCGRPPRGSAAAPCSRAMVVVHGLATLTRRPPRPRAATPSSVPTGRHQHGRGERRSSSSSSTPRSAPRTCAPDIGVVVVVSVVDPRSHPRRRAG